MKPPLHPRTDQINKGLNYTLVDLTSQSFASMLPWREHKYSQCVSQLFGTLVKFIGGITRPLTNHHSKTVWKRDQRQGRELYGLSPFPAVQHSLRPPPPNNDICRYCDANLRTARSPSPRNSITLSTRARVLTIFHWTSVVYLKTSYPPSQPLITTTKTLEAYF